MAVSKTKNGGADGQLAAKLVVVVAMWAADPCVCYAPHLRRQCLSVVPCRLAFSTLGGG